MAGSALTNASVKFSERLKTLGMGAIDDEATRELDNLTREMARLAKATGGKPKGSMTLKLSFTLEGDVFDIRPELSVKRPPPPRPRAVLFAGPDGILSETSHTQTQMEFTAAPMREVEAPAAEPVRDVAAPEPRPLRAM